MKSRRAGFTMLELMLVITIGSLMTMIAIPRINVSKARAESAVRSTRMALIAAQQRAVLRQHDVVVEFDEDAGQLHFFDDANRSGDLDDGERAWVHALEETIVFGRGLAPVGPVGSDAIGFDEGDGGLPQVTFHRSGSASEAGGFYVGSPRAAAAAEHMDEAFAITVARATGRVRMHRVVNGAWREAY